MSDDTDAAKPASKEPTRKVMRLNELEQIKVLADPLRIRILEELCEGDKTTKQVAERIGEKPTKLYHHIEALERVGLIELTRTRQNRGTIEKYYMAVARSFEVDSRVFTAGEESSDEEKATVRSMVSTIFDTSSAELMKVIETSRGKDRVEKDGVLGFLEVRAGEEVIGELRSRLQAILDWLRELDDPEDDEDYKRFRLTLAYFPLEPPADDRKTE